MTPQYIQWTILTLLHVAIWKIPLVQTGFKFDSSIFGYLHKILTLGMLNTPLIFILLTCSLSVVCLI